MPTFHDTPTDSPNETFSLKAAAERAGVSTSTVRRRKEALLAAGAEITSTGWLIPANALRSVFVVPPDTPNETLSENPIGTPADNRSGSELVEQLRSENAFLRQQVEQQARTIERQAEAHAVISAQLSRLGQIEAGDSAAPSAPQQAASEPPKTPNRRRWWRLRNAST